MSVDIHIRCPRCGYKVWACGCATHEDDFTPAQDALVEAHARNVPDVDFKVETDCVKGIKPCPFHAAKVTVT